jgi:WhiB family redox-sensing transcriptional regulator
MAAAKRSDTGVAHLGRLVAPDLDRTWQSKAACRDAPDPDIFFPKKGDHGDQAKEVCAACQVAAPCLEFALKINRGAYDFGIYGGTTPGERARLRRRLARADSSREAAERRQAARQRKAASERLARLRNDPAQAKAAFDLAREVGPIEAARQLGVSYRSLYRAWDRHGLGRPVLAARPRPRSEPRARFGRRRSGDQEEVGDRARF